MIVFLHGFDWAIYTDVVMPAFAYWLLERDESAVAALFEQTRCAQEEAFLPAPMQRLRSWVRAQVFVQKLPRGLNSLQEYEQLCSPEAFTLLSDRYLHLHPPQLYQQNDALRTVWGAILETHCLPWRQKALNGDIFPLSTIYLSDENDTDNPDEQSDRALEIRSELLSLLRTAGLDDLANQIDESISHIERIHLEANDENSFDSTDSPNSPDSSSKTDGEFDEARRTGELDIFDALDQTNEFDESPQTGDLGAFSHTEALGELAGPVLDDIDIEQQFTMSLDNEEVGEVGEDDLVFTTQLGGIEIGGASDLLQLRGWLASISLRAMAMFEYLACGRRSMPFGYVTGEPYNYAGYLTPDEVQQLAACLRNALPPARKAVVEDQQRFRQQQHLPLTSEHFRLTDEVLPVYAGEFLQAVRTAASENLGLICGIE
jgi:hypothetical protein